MPTNDSDSVPATLLVVDDDVPTRVVMAEALRRLGYVVHEASDGVEGLELAQQKTPDLVLLDLEMPRLNGWHTLEVLRDRGFRGGVIMLTGADNTEAIVRALGRGADDFVSKPCVLRELVARLNAVLRRSLAGREGGVIRIGAVKVDLKARTAQRDGQPITLTQTEYKLLEVLDTCRGHAVMRDELLKKVWGYSSSACSRTVDTHVWRLRQKLGVEADDPCGIRTVPGGYRLAVGPTEAAAGASAS